MRTFGSDNFAGIHPEILEAIARANEGHEKAYGNDPYTTRAVNKFKELFGANIEVLFVFGGTGANCISLKACTTDSFNAIICAETAHISEHECGAPEHFTGCKLITIPTKNGKLTVDQIKSKIFGIGDEHCSQPKVISITQSTELGTLYSPKEIKVVADFAHKNNMFLHIDGARIANAVAALKCDIKAITVKAGVDILSFGGAKNGMMVGEAVVCFNKELSKNLKYFRKQAMQLPSKMRFIAAQFETLLTNDLWLKNASNANEMAKLLASYLNKIPQIKLLQKVQTNIIFADMPQKYIPIVQKKYFFYEETAGVRFVTSFDTTKQDIEDFAKCLKDTLKS